MDYRKILQELGYTKHEATVYLALLKLGVTQAGPIIKATKLHGMLVYSALEKLQDYGLVTVVHQKNIKKFHALNPSHLLGEIRKKQEAAEKIIPELQKMQTSLVPQVSVKTFVGKEGLTNNLKDMVASAAKSKSKCMHIIGGAKGTDFYDALGDFYDEYLALTKRHGVKKKIVTPSNYSSQFRKRFNEEANAIRALSKGLDTPAYTRITEDMVSIEIYKPEIVVIQIDNAIIARGYLDSFKLLWDAAK